MKRWKPRVVDRLMDVDRDGAIGSLVKSSGSTLFEMAVNRLFST